MNMKNKYSAHLGFRITRNFWIYLMGLFFSLIFTQALRSTVSAMMFYFMLILPILSFIYAFMGKLAIGVFVNSDETTISKFSPIDYEYNMVNSTILSFPFMEAVVSTPDTEGIRCTERMFSFSMMPMGNYVLKNRVAFKYRGRYRMGIECIYIYDFFRMFCLKQDIGVFVEVIVLPRRLTFDMSQITATTDIPTDSVRLIYGNDRSEIGNIRTYQQGDALKTIHWKLSSKTQDLQVKEFNTNTGKAIYIFADFAKMQDEVAFVPNDDLIPKKIKTDKKIKIKTNQKNQDYLEKNINFVNNNNGKNGSRHNISEEKESFGKRNDNFDFISANIIKSEFLNDIHELRADGIAEITVAIAERELRAGNSCTLIWFDPRTESGISMYELSSLQNFDEIFKYFSTSPLCESENRVVRLTSFIKESINVTIRIVTSAADGGSIAEYSAIPSLFGGAGTGCVTEILLYNPDNRYQNSVQRSEYLSLCSSRLAQNGISFTQINSVELV